VLIALGQIKPAIGDIGGNVALLREWIADARAAGAQLVLFPELALSGYPPEDLLLRTDFVERCGEAVDEVAAAAEGIVVAYGAPLHGPRDLHNALVIAAGGKVRAVYHKVELPNYGIFDEGRYFGRGSGRALVRLGGHLVGLTICADLWIPDGPAAAAARAGAELILNASASTYHAGKAREREALLFQRARDMVCPIAYCNMWGGMDELVFDGGSMAVDQRGNVIAGGTQFHDELVLCSLDLRPVRAARLRDPRLRVVAPDAAAEPSLDPGAVLADVELPPGRADLCSSPPVPAPSPEEEMWSALTLGIADHARNVGLTDAVVGLDGGIDSAVVALLAADALGPERLTCVAMPSQDSDPDAEAGARELAAALGCALRVIHTDALHAGYLELLEAELAGADGTRTSERIRARIRANVLMALADAHRWLHLSTGNKSELACGYSTLYGETFGGFAAIKDVPRTLVTRLAHWRQRRGPGRPLPERMLALAHAGMHPSPWASDGLPAFEAVDPILQAYVEDDEDPDTIAARGHDPALVRRIVALVEAAEPKRRQTPPGIKISVRAFERDRRMPLTHRFGNGQLQGYGLWETGCRSPVAKRS
jgi:NAD+ synthase (glutamine-hydrolysing)